MGFCDSDRNRLPCPDVFHVLAPGSVSFACSSDALFRRIGNPLNLPPRLRQVRLLELDVKTVSTNGRGDYEDIRLNAH